MKSNTHNISKDKDNSCALFSAIFACKIREATSSILTEIAPPLCRSLNRAEREREQEREQEREREVCACRESKISLSCGSTSERLAVKETR